MGRLIALSVRRPFGGCLEWAGGSDANRGPPAPKAGALAGLRHTPTTPLKIEQDADKINACGVFG